MRFCINYVGLVRGRQTLIYACSTAIAIRGKDGVVLGVEKLITSKLHEPTSNKRIFTIDKHIGVVSQYYSPFSVL